MRLAPTSSPSARFRSRSSAPSSPPFIGFHEWTGTGYEHFAAWAAGVPVAGCYADNAHTVAIEPLLK
jgi:hypothetical protein